ncbi:heterokaryon incompatibility protein-domain-containing protein [Rhexocercosporidium sp. MPI-PUGE-AT-0058]|nr:heterokaryon incompatibility protein-domain-containing protein [Rhexocercosporidium sp. MPI-PUGE-AT-0058]
MLQTCGSNSVQSLVSSETDEVRNVQMVTRADDPLGELFKAREIEPYSKSERCLNLLETWIKKCHKEHPLCSWSTDLSLPTRVIDVGAQTQDPFLFESNGARGEWLTLSHCWGGISPLQTTSHTLDTHKSSIPIGSLPETFRDAIFLTRRLGYKYLWIDSLCIIQNSHEDWISESSQMFRIYANAAINLSASAARNPRDGIFNSGDQQRKFSAPLTTFHCRSNAKDIEGEVGVRLQISGKGLFVLLPNEPLHCRAWVLQESVLSPRRIDFASTQLYWECRTTVHTEGYPESNDGAGFLKASGRTLHQVNQRQMDPHPHLKQGPVLEDPVSWWYMMLNNSYRGRKITMDSDVFPALAGVAEEVGRRSGFHYKAGLWLEDIHRGLLWQPLHSLKKSKDVSCPSWSWASARLPAPDCRLALDRYAAGHRATVLDVEIKTTGENEFGRISSGTLKLECNVHSFNDWKEPLLPVYNEHGGDFKSMRMHTRYLQAYYAVAYARAQMGRVLCTVDVRPDDVDSCHSEMVQRRAICAQIASFKVPDLGINNYKRAEDITDWKTIIYGLILEPVDDSSQVYKRIGIVEIAEEDGLAEGWEKKKLTII